MVYHPPFHEAYTRHTPVSNPGIYLPVLSRSVGQRGNGTFQGRGVILHHSFTVFEFRNTSCSLFIFFMCMKSMELDEHIHVCKLYCCWDPIYYHLTDLVSPFYISRCEGSHIFEYSQLLLQNQDSGETWWSII